MVMHQGRLTFGELWADAPSKSLRDSTRLADEARVPLVQQPVCLGHIKARVGKLMCHVNIMAHAPVKVGVVRIELTTL